MAGWLMHSQGAFFINQYQPKKGVFYVLCTLGIYFGR